jgi:hypothetical protein
MKSVRSFARCLKPSSIAVSLVTLAFVSLQPTSLLAQEKDYQEWLKKQEGEYDQYMQQQDKDFLQFLGREWKQTDLEPAKPMYPKPKPSVTPAVRKEPPAVEPKVSGKPIAVPKPAPPVVIAPSLPRVPAPPTPEKYSLVVKVDYFGVPVEIRSAPFNVRLGAQFSESSIRDFWKGLSQSHNEVVIEQSLKWKKEMQLNDWGYFLLVKKISEALFPSTENESVLASWFLLMKSGYDARVGYEDGLAYLLLPATKQLYGLPYFSFSGSTNRYYAFNLASDRWRLPRAVTTYEGDYSGATKLFDFSLSALPHLGSRPVPKKIRFTYGQEIRSISVTVDPSLVEFLKQYPQTPFDVYFNAPVSAAAAHDLLEGLTPLVKGKNEIEAVNILLRFVQTAFKYKTDQEIFGREKPFFVDETLFYEGSDCEDRAVLFSFLVKNLTGLPVVGLNYPGHMATAVKFSTDAGGDVVQVGGVKYTVCDPTYVFADAGRSMPEFRAKEPRVIAMK